MMLNELKDDIANETYTFISDDEETMQGLLEAAEKITLKQMPDTKLIEYFLDKSKDLTNVTAYNEMKYRNLISKDDNFSSLRRKLEQYRENLCYEQTVMKNFTLVIDTSASNPEGSQIYVYEADTLQEAKDKLTEFNLSFKQGDVYCATIGERNPGTLNRYQQIERTDDGVKWYDDNSNGHSYIPVEWKRVEDWQNIDKFKKPVESISLSDTVIAQNNLAEIDPYKIGKINLEGYSPELLTELERIIDAEINRVKQEAKKYYDAHPSGIDDLDAPDEYENLLSELQDGSNNVYYHLEYKYQNKTEDNSMNITARVTPIEDGTKLKGLATVTLGDQIDIHNVKIVQSDEKGLFLSMPGEKGTNGTFYESAIPASPEALQNLKTAVLTEYERTLEFGKKEKTEKSPEDVKIKVSGIRENTRDNNIKGSCNVTIGDTMVIKGVKVIETKNGDLSIGMPSKMNADGEYTSVITPRSPEFFAQVKAAVIEAYHNRDSIIGNTSYHKLGEEPAHKVLNSQFAEKVAEQLNADKINWSGKVSGEKTSIAVSKADAPKLDAAIEKTKTAIQEAKKAQDNPPLPEAPPVNRGAKR